jgi:hypothetical protein
LILIKRESKLSIIFYSFLNLGTLRRKINVISTRAIPAKGVLVSVVDISSDVAVVVVLTVVVVKAVVEVVVLLTLEVGRGIGLGGGGGMLAFNVM